MSRPWMLFASIELISIFNDYESTFSHQLINDGFLD